MKTLIALALVLAPAFAQASTKYVCETSANNALGIGLRVEIELLNDSTANVSPFMTEINGKKVMQVTVENPGQFTQSGDVIHLENVVHAKNGQTGTMQIDVDTVKMQMTFPKDKTPAIPCVKN